jgi:hypothetical protein
MYAEPLAVVNGVVHGVDLQLAAVAGARIHLPDGEAAVEFPSDRFLQLRADLDDLRLDPGLERFGDNACAKSLVKNP